MRHTRLLTAILLLLPFCLAAQQICIPNTHVTLDLPLGEWSYLKTANIDKQTDMYLYIYTDTMVTNAAGDTIIPYLRIYVNRGYKGSIYELAYERFVQQPFQSMNEYTDGIPANGFGYIGAYQSEYDKKEYQFRMIYFKEKNNAIEIRLETSGDTYALFDKKFDSILRTVAIKK